jgi:hypothetical protein
LREKASLEEVLARIEAQRSRLTASLDALKIFVDAGSSPDSVELKFPENDAVLSAKTAFLARVAKENTAKKCCRYARWLVQATTSGSR